MIKYTAIYKNTGIVFGILTINNINELPADESLYYIEGAYDGSKYYFENENPIEIPEKPSEYHIFDPITKQWVVNAPQLTRDILQKRQKLLLASDWTQIPNNPLTLEKQTAWAVYRQALRDITSQPGYPTNVVWPTQPGSTTTT
jgi:hypothetical protein